MTFVLAVPGPHPILTVVAWLFALGWLWQALQWLLHGSELPDLTRLPLPRLPDPIPGAYHLTVVVPACNEESSIAQTLRSLLSSQDIRLQIIAINDRSTDSTGQIIDQVAAEFAMSSSPHSLQALHITELPAGWLGKPHALALGAQRSTTPWILFTDGDVSFDAHALVRALAYAESEEADHLVLMPDWVMGSPGECAMHGAMHAIAGWTLRMWKVADPTARDFLGVGAFNLLRRSAYDALGGFESLRMEVLEDVRLGWRVKRAGYRQRLALGPGLARVRWSHGAWGVVRNLEKNLFSLYRFRVLLATMAIAGVAVQIALPLVALAVGGAPRLAAVAIGVALLVVYSRSAHITRVPPGYVLLYPFAAALFLFAMVRSMALALIRGGVTWRGTLYPLAELRKAAGPFWN